MRVTLPHELRVYACLKNYSLQIGASRSACNVLKDLAQTYGYVKGVRSIMHGEYFEITLSRLANARFDLSLKCHIIAVKKHASLAC